MSQICPQVGIGGPDRDWNLPGLSRMDQVSRAGFKASGAGGHNDDGINIVQQQIKVNIPGQGIGGFCYQINLIPNPASSSDQRMGRFQCTGNPQDGCLG